MECQPASMETLGQVYLISELNFATNSKKESSHIGIISPSLSPSDDPSENFSNQLLFVIISITKCAHPTAIPLSSNYVP